MLKRVVWVSFSNLWNHVFSLHPVRPMHMTAGRLVIKSHGGDVILIEALY